MVFEVSESRSSSLPTVDRVQDHANDGVFRCLAIDKSINADTTDSAVSFITPAVAMESSYNLHSLSL